MEELIKELGQKIVELLGLFDTSPDDITADTTFFDDGLGIDSVDILELVVMLDRDYGVVIDSRELGEKVFVTMATLAQFVADSR